MLAFFFFVSSGCPPGAIHDGAALAEALAGDAAEVWVGGVVRGRFHAERTLHLRGCEGGTLDGEGEGTVLKLTGEDILVEDLTLRGSGRSTSREDGALKLHGARNIVRRVVVEDTLYGIALEQCEACGLEQVRVQGRPVEEALQGDAIKLWEAHHSHVSDCVVSSSRDAVVWYSRGVTLSRNTIHGGRYGTHFMYAHDSTVVDSDLRDNVVGVFVMYSSRVRVERNILAGGGGPAGMGIGFKESDDVTLKDNRFVKNTTGLFFDNTPRSPGAVVVVEDNEIALNAVALRVHGGGRGVRLIGNDLTGNDVTVQVDGNGDALAAVVRGNHWDDYAGYDLDGDGEGDVPFLVERPLSDLGDRRPALRFFAGTPALAVVDWAGRALPFLGKQLLLKDEAPAMKKTKTEKKS